MAAAKSAVTAESLDAKLDAVLSKLASVEKELREHRLLLVNANQLLALLKGRTGRM